MQVIDLETKEISEIQDLINELAIPDNADAKKQTRFGVETKLDAYYRAALQLHSYSQSFSIAQVSLMPGLGKRLLEELEDRVLPNIQERSDAHILNVVIRALTEIIPGGYINKLFVRDFFNSLQATIA